MGLFCAEKATRIIKSSVGKPLSLMTDHWPKRRWSNEGSLSFRPIFQRNDEGKVFGGSGGGLIENR